MDVHYQWYAVQMLILVNHHGHAPLVVQLHVDGRTTRFNINMRLNNPATTMRQWDAKNTFLWCFLLHYGIKEVYTGLSPLNSSRTILLLGLWFIT